MTYEKYYEILAANQDDELTLDEMIGVVAEMYHATPDQVQEVPEIVDALEVYQDDQDLKKLIESLMHETSEKFIPCGNCEEVYPAEDLVDAGTGKWTDDLCPGCLVQEPKGQISLAAARVNAGLLQREAAELIGVTELTIRNWELGNYKPSPERYPAIEEAYKMPIESIKI